MATGLILDALNIYRTNSDKKNIFHGDNGKVFLKRLIIKSAINQLKEMIQR